VPRITWLTHAGHALDDWMMEETPSVASHTPAGRDGSTADIPSQTGSPRFQCNK